MSSDKDIPAVMYDNKKKIAYRKGRFFGKVSNLLLVQFGHNRAFKGRAALSSPAFKGQTPQLNVIACM